VSTIAFASFFIRDGLLWVRRSSRAFYLADVFDFEGRVEFDAPGYTLFSALEHGCLGGHGVQVDEKFKVHSPGS
jgi:hypothetical protein